MNKLKKTIILAIVLSLFTSVSSCSNQQVDINEQQSDFSECEFNVNLPNPLIQGETLYFEIVDEVTGIALNPARYKMETIDGLNYSIKLPFADQSIVKYRYVKTSQETLIEKDSLGKNIIYRTHLIDGPVKVNDIVAAWDENGYSGSRGEISGFIFDKNNQVPLGEILVIINGMRTFTTHDGYFEFKNVPVGEFQISAINVNGFYLPFQQKAIIAENSVTPASFGMTPTDLVEVAFNVQVPDYTDPEAIVRLLGNTALLGNTFSELNGGTSIMASRSIQLQNLGNGQYETKIRLPAGLDFRYKYTLGDGFINAEHNESGSYKTRQIIIPAKAGKKSDVVESWYSQKGFPVTFNIKTPSYTPSEDYVSLQLNPFTWMTPIPIWNTAANQWHYTLYSPLEYLQNAAFRFCRNNLCGITDDEVTQGYNPEAFKLTISNDQPIQIDYDISKWHGLEPGDYAIMPASFPPQSSIKIKSFSISPIFNSDWIGSMDQGFIEAGVSGANWLFFSPTWVFDGNTSRFQPNENFFASDILKIKQKTNEAGLSMALYPQIDQAASSGNYWQSSNLTYQWWQKWFSNYEQFLLNYAIFAEANDLKTLVIGGSAVSPAFPEGKLPNGNSSNSPYNINDQWTELIENLRSKFTGQIGFALPFSITDSTFASEISSKADFLLIEMDTTLSDSENPGIDLMTEKFIFIVDNQLFSFYTKVQKPVILSLNIPSIDGAAKSCIFSPMCPRITDSATDVNEQADIYQVILKSVTERNWILGIDSAGFNPSAFVKDNSASILGKPAMEVVKYYYSNLK